VKKLKIYLDTSVINFLFADDAPEKKQATVEFFDQYVKLEIYEVYISDIVIAEIQETKNETKRKKLLQVLNKYPIEYVQFQNTSDIEFLASTYIEKGIIPQQKQVDAIHVATATVNEMDVLLSWNYKHLANIFRERRIIAENVIHNYWHNLRILTPLELIGKDDER